MIDDTQAKNFFAHASTLTPDCFMFTDSQMPEWWTSPKPTPFKSQVLDNIADGWIARELGRTEGDVNDSGFDFDKMVELTSKTNLVSGDNKRKAFYKPCDKCENGPVCYEGGETSHDWCMCEK